MAEPSEQKPSLADAYADDVIEQIENPVPAATQPVATPPPSVRHKHSNFLTGQALNLGFSEDEIHSHSSDQLEALVYHVSKRLLAERRDASQQHTMQNPTTPQVVNLPPAPEPEPDLDMGVDEDGKPLAQQLAPGLKKFLAGLVKDNQDLKRQLNESAKQHEARLLAARVDNFFNAQDEAMFGRGMFEEMDGRTKAAKMRASVFEAASLLKSGTVEQKLAKAMKIILADEPAPATKPVPAPGDDEAAKWLAATVAQPTNRKIDEEKPGPAKARRAVAAVLREQVESEGGLNGVPTEDSEYP